MLQAATQSATRSKQTATLRQPNPMTTAVAVLVADVRARNRVIVALRSEGLVPRAITARDVAVSGLTGAPVAALIYDLAPWNDEAIKFLRRLRHKGLPANLPVLIYAPPRPEVGKLLVDAGRMPMIWGELQVEENSDIARLRNTLRQMIAVTPAAIVLQLLMVYAPNLPSLALRFCEAACVRLGAARGENLTVSSDSLRSWR